MTLNINKELAALRQITVGQLRTKYADVFGEGTNARNKPWLIKRIAWRMQALEEGDLSDRARRRAAELARDADLRVTAPRVSVQSTNATGQIASSAHSVVTDKRLPMPGTVLTRAYKGETVEVKVLRNGFEHAGEVYKSLTAVAKSVTGSHWNGYHFFGLRKSDKLR